jgi:hypothetical protein
MRRSLALHAAAMKSGSGRRRRCKEEEIAHAEYRALVGVAGGSCAMNRVKAS